MALLRKYDSSLCVPYSRQQCNLAAAAFIGSSTNTSDWYSGKTPEELRKPDERAKCYNCGQPGHIFRYCPYRAMKFRRTTMTAPMAFRPRAQKSRRTALTEQIARSTLPVPPPRRPKHRDSGRSYQLPNLGGTNTEPNGLLTQELLLT